MVYFVFWFVCSVFLMVYLVFWECVFGIFDGIFRISDCVFYQQASGLPDPLALHQDLAPGSA